MAWLSAHLFYNEPLETFLIKAVNPYIKSVLKTGIAESYFYVRYWEQGPHIRLRFKGEASALEEVLKPNLTEHFQAYFDAKPSEREEPDYPENFPEELHWLPNNSIAFQDYEPEVNRYGGIKGVAFSEGQFQLSSATVLNYLVENTKDENYHEILGAAIRLHLGFAYSIGMNKEEMIAFFNMIFENWLPRSFEIFKDNTPDEVVVNKMKETISLFEQSFEDQKEILIPFHTELLEDLKTEESFESTDFNKWLKENRSLSLKMKEAATSGHLKERSDTYEISKELNAELSKNDFLLWNIWADYVHMTNNRLGIVNRDEAYLAYLIKRSLIG